MGIVARLTADEQAEIDELQKSHKRAKEAADLAAKNVSDEATLINAWVVRVRRKYNLAEGDQIRPDSGDIVRPEGGVIVEGGA